MQAKNSLSILLLIIIFQTVINDCTAKNKIQSIIYTKNTDVIIGYKTNDSTGKVTITNSQIQQSVISLFPLISQSSIANMQPYISVGKNATYLIFQVTSPRGDTTNVALNLTASGNDLFLASLGKRKIYLCRENKQCTTCGFAMNPGKKIIGCYIKKMRQLSPGESDTFLISD